MSVNALSIRDHAVGILSELPTWGGRVFKRRLIPTRADELPCILVYVGRERFQAYGKGTSGRPDFTVTLELSVSVVINGGSDTHLDDKLSAAAQSILNALMCNADFMMSFEAVTAIETTYAVPHNAETILGHCTHVLTIQYSEQFRPNISDVLAGVDIHTSGEYDSPSTGARVNLPTGG